MTPMKAIRAKCLDCCCGSAHEVNLCPCEECTLYPYRFGKNPSRRGLVNGGSFAKTHGSTADLAHDPAAEGNYSFPPADAKKGGN